MSSIQAISDSKKALRTTIKERLSQLSAEDVAQQSEITQIMILSLPHYANANSISIYLSMPTAECQTDITVRDALNYGKRVFVPYIHRRPQQRSVIEMLRLKSFREFEGLERDAWGIPSLPAEGLEVRENALGGFGINGDGDAGEAGGLDLVLVPGVAFDAGMSRLGHGKGFYDEFLTRYCESGRRKPFLVGLCLKEQYLEDGDEAIPTSEHDWRMDAVAVGDGRLCVAKSA